MFPWCSDCFWCREWYKVMERRGTSLDIYFILIFQMLHYLPFIGWFLLWTFSCCELMQKPSSTPLQICVHRFCWDLNTNVAKLEWTNAAIWPWMAYLLQWDSLNIYLSLLMILQASMPLMVLMERQGFAAPKWWNCEIKTSELGYIFRTLQA